MSAINIQLAGHVACISSDYRISSTMYDDFRTCAPAEFSILITDDDIDFSRAKKYGLRSIQVIASSILYKMTEALLEYDILLMHGAVIAHNDNAYMFTAPSGTGKTTHLLKWMHELPDSFVVNGDKPYIRFNVDGAILACGSPWAGKEDFYTNSMVPLKSIIFMERSEDNRIKQITFAEAFPFLLQQVYRPEDEGKMRKTLRLMQRLPQSVTFWHFKCNNFKDDCFEVAYNALVRDQK